MIWDQHGWTYISSHQRVTDQVKEQKEKIQQRKKKSRKSTRVLLGK